MRDLDTERHVLGHLLLGYADVQAEYVAAGLSRDDFSLVEHALIFDAVGAVVAAGIVADLPTVGQELRTRGHLKAVGGPYFGALIDGVPRPTPEGVRYLADILSVLGARREMASAARILASEVGDAEDLDDTIARHLTHLEQAQTRRAADDLLTADGQWTATARELERETGRRIYLGWQSLDEALDGVRPGEVCGVMARPGVGKTLVLCNVMCRVAEEGLGHVVFSLEMPAPQIVERVQRMFYGLGKYDWRGNAKAGRLSRDAYTSAFAGQIVVQTPSLSVAEMTRRIQKAKVGALRSRGVALVSIDHLGLIGGDRKMSTYDRVSTQAREIKELAKRHDVAVLLLVQVNRDSGGDGSRELGLGSARDSGVVEEAMDYLVTLRRMDQALSLTPFERERYKGIIFAKVVKNRHNDVSGQEVALRLEGHTLRLTEDPNVQADTQDLAKVAAVSGRRR